MATPHHPTTAAASRRGLSPGATVMATSTAAGSSARGHGDHDGDRIWPVRPRCPSSHPRGPRWPLALGRARPPPGRQTRRGAALSRSQSPPAEVELRKGPGLAIGATRTTTGEPCHPPVGVELRKGPGPLSRQGSIYSLTFDEFQNTLGGMGAGLGKDFGSMNMDELLRSIWTAEESQAMALASATASAAGAGAAADGGAALQRQGSLTLPRTLSVKTVDEVWRDFAREGPPGTAGGAEPQPNRQPTLGEMTLEEFLVKAGVVRDNPAAAAAAAAAAVPAQPVAPRPIQALNNGASIFFGNFGGANDAGAGAMGFAPVGIRDQAMVNGMMPAVPGMAGGAVTVSPVDTSVAQLDSMGKGNGDLSSPMAPVPYPFEGVIRGRRSGAVVEKVVERRQRRMIKNRESAARSRARKQAYTMELEAEVQKLKEQNAELQKKQEEIMEMQKNQVLDVVSNPYAQKKRCLRRTLTGPW